jgi:hypothetical protein
MISFYELGKIVQEVNMTALLGIDCSTDPKKTGLALGEKRDGIIHIFRCTTGSKSISPALLNHLGSDCISAILNRTDPFSGVGPFL